MIVIDDSSTNDGAQCVQRYKDPRLRLIRQDNQGISAARDKGIREAKDAAEDALLRVKRIEIMIARKDIF